MTERDYRLTEEHMLREMQDSAHDRDHIYRVLYVALRLAESEPVEDMGVLIAACLLHDIGRAEQYADPKRSHAEVGSEKAYTFLRSIGWAEPRAGHVRDCVRSHSYRAGNPPASMEAKLLFDADKLDACGVIGIARSLLYCAEVGRPIYTLAEDGTVLDGGETEPSLLREYRYKLEKLYGRMQTESGRALALQRRAAAVACYEALLGEMRVSNDGGRARLRAALAGKKTPKEP